MTGLFKSRERQIQKVVMIDIGLVIPNRSQPRIEFDQDELYSLAGSIKENGILQPINVRRSGVNYEIVSGERRFRAAKLCGLQEVPCIIIEADDEKSAVLALIENIQRRDLSFFEEAIAIEKLIKYYGLTQEEAASRLGKAQSTVANKLRLLKFSDSERNLIVRGNITERQARALIRIDDQSKRLKLLDEIIRKHLNIEQTEEMVNNIISEVQNLYDGSPKSPVKKKKFLFPVPRLYINSINKIVKTMKEANIDCETFMSRDGEYYEYTIKIHSAAEI